MSATIVEDAALLHAMIGGETAALEELYERYAGQVLGLATRILCDRGRAEDAVQDVFLSLWRSASSYDVARGSVRSWLFRAVRNRCIDYQRQSASRPRLVSDDTAIERVPTPNIDDMVIASVDGEVVRRAFGQLPEEQARVVRLAYYDCLTQREIATMLDLPLGTVKSRMRLGLHALRRQLAA